MKTVTLFAALSFTAVTVAADATATSEGLAAVEELGRVNGLALACQQPALSSRARNAIVTGAPKTRDHGEAFDKATNASFLAQGKGGTCPAATALAQQLDSAEKRLQAAFPPAK